MSHPTAPGRRTEGWGGCRKPALQHEPGVLACPLSCMIPPTATTPIVLVVSYLWGLRAPLLVIPICLSERCWQGQRVENWDELWPETAGDGQPPCYLYWLFFSQLKIVKSNRTKKGC